MKLNPGWADSCYLAAEDQGFFEDRGITVSEPLATSTSADLNRAMVSGEGDIALGSVDLMSSAIGEEPPLVRFIGSGNVAQSGFLAHTDKLEDLRGKTIAFGTQTTTSTVLAQSVINDVLGEGGYEPLYVGGGGAGARVAAVQAGEADAAITIPPYDQAAIAEDPSLKVSYPEPTEDSATYTVVLTGNARWLEENPETAAGWLAAYLDGCDWVYDPANRDAVVALTVENTGLSREVISTSYDQWIAGDRSGEVVSKDAALDPQKLGNYLRIAVAAGAMPAETDVNAVVDAFYDPSVLEAATALREEDQ